MAFSPGACFITTGTPTIEVKVTLDVPKTGTPNYSYGELNPGDRASRPQVRDYRIIPRMEGGMIASSI